MSRIIGTIGDEKSKLISKKLTAWYRDMNTNESGKMGMGWALLIPVFRRKQQANVWEGKLQAGQRLSETFSEKKCFIEFYLSFQELRESVAVMVDWWAISMNQVHCLRQQGKQRKNSITYGLWGQITPYSAYLQRNEYQKECPWYKFREHW